MIALGAAGRGHRGGFRVRPDAGPAAAPDPGGHAAGDADPRGGGRGGVRPAAGDLRRAWPHTGPAAGHLGTLAGADRGRALPRLPGAVARAADARGRGGGLLHHLHRLRLPPRRRLRRGGAVRRPRREREPVDLGRDAAQYAALPHAGPAPPAAGQGAEPVGGLPPGRLRHRAGRGAGGRDRRAGDRAGPRLQAADRHARRAGTGQDLGADGRRHRPLHPRPVRGPSRTAGPGVAQSGRRCGLRSGWPAPR